MMSPDRLAATARRVTERIAPTIERVHPALPTEARHLIQINGALQVAGGVLLNTRLSRPAAVLLAGSLIPTTLAGHAFWAVEDPQQRAIQRVQLLKNLGLLGGLLLGAVDTRGQPGLPWRAHRALADTNKALHRSAKQTREKTRLAMKAANIGRHLPG